MQAAGISRGLAQQTSHMPSCRLQRSSRRRFGPHVSRSSRRSSNSKGSALQSSSAHHNSSRSSSSISSSSVDEEGQTSQPHPSSSRARALCNSAEDTLQACMERVCTRDLDAFLEYIPDDVIDSVLAQRAKSGTTEPVRFADVLSASSELQFLDTYALRTLVLSCPDSLRPLSAVHVTPERYLQRCECILPTGEECLLTFDLQLQDTLESQYRGPPLLSKKWMLCGVAGECSGEELPSHPSPSFSPEAVVEAQLQALRDSRLGAVFAHASPACKASIGPIQHFAHMLRHNPLYLPLLGHAAAEVLEQQQLSDELYTARVAVTAAPELRLPPHVYLWVVRRQGEGSHWRNCWMTDAVQAHGGPLAGQWVQHAE